MGIPDTKTKEHKEFKKKILSMVTYMLTDKNKLEVIEMYWKLFDMCTED